MGFFHRLLSFVAATMIAFVLGSLFQTQMVLAALAAAGAPVALLDRLGLTASDMTSLLPTYGAVIAVSFAIAFPVAWRVREVLPALTPLTYPLAGAAAIGVALAAMSAAFHGITPLAGARGAAGFSLQCLAGAAGGAVFEWFAKRRRS